MEVSIISMLTIRQKEERKSKKQTEMADLKGSAMRQNPRHQRKGTHRRDTGNVDEAQSKHAERKKEDQQMNTLCAPVSGHAN